MKLRFASRRRPFRASVPPGLSTLEFGVWLGSVESSPMKYDLVFYVSGLTCVGGNQACNTGHCGFSPFGCEQAGWRERKEVRAVSRTRGRSARIAARH